MTSTVVVAIGAVTLALLVLGASAAALFTYLRREMAPANRHGDLMEQYGIRISQMEVIVEGLPSLWEEERRRAKRDADSARKAREIAESKLEEVTELLEESADLSSGNGSGSEQLELQPVRRGLGLPRAPDHQERIERVAHLLR